MVYRSSRFAFAGDKLESIEGTLTLAGVTKPLKLNVTTFRCGAHPFNRKPMCGATAEATLKRSDFGVKAAMGAVSDEVRLQLSVEVIAE
jgi:polyisoprenoid-binding protein YceI